MGNSRKKVLTLAVIGLSLLISRGFAEIVSSSNSGTNSKYSSLKSMFASLSASNPMFMLLLGSQSESLNDLNLRDKDLYKSDTGRTKLKFLKTPQIYRTDNLRSSETPVGLERNENLDSSLNYVKTRESFDSVTYAYPYTSPIEDYLNNRKQKIQKKLWDSLIASYDMKKGLAGGDLAAMLSQATGFTIPLPPNPVIGIFGKPELSVNVNGEVNLKAGWRWDSQNLGTVSAFGQSQSSPIFSQDIRLNVNARIGDKLKLGTDWNTKNNYDLNGNKFKIGFDGYDDDIVKKVEFGNVEFPLPTTLITGASNLFGVRADFQFGPLYLKSVISQRRGQKKTLPVNGGATKQYFSLRAYDYAKNHFFLDSIYKTVYDDYFKTATPTPSKLFTQYRVKQIQVWEANTEITDPLVAYSVAIADLPGKKRMMGENWNASEIQRPMQEGMVVKSRFSLLDSNRYRIDYNLGTLTIRNMRQDRYYAVSYRTEGATNSPDDDVYYGTFSNQKGERDTSILKLIYVPNLIPSYSILWNRQMKNIYPINSTNINVAETKIGIWYTRKTNDSVDVLEGAPDKLVTIFGVDQTNNATGTPNPDGLFDLRTPFFDPSVGEITFPNTEPFGDGLRKYFKKLGNPELAELYSFDQVYDTTYDVARKNTARDRFVISGEVTGRQANRIALGAYNLPPNSVKVTLDGIPLREYDDYQVDYSAGIVTIKNPRASLPNSNLRVEYEQQDIFTIATKTMLGLRGDLTLWKSRNLNAGLGFTALYYDQASVIDKVRLGDEPIANSMMGIDGKISLNAPWLTKALDMLPFYDTKAPSSINLRGEYAMIIPTPNKKESTIASDNSSPVATIDDFEAAQRPILLSLTPSQWQHSSSPEDTLMSPTAEGRDLYRGKMYWWQYFIARVPVQEVYPNNKNYSPGNNYLRPLYIKFDPNYRGIYNKNAQFLDRNNPQFDSLNVWSDRPENRSKIWGGMMRLLSSFTTNFDNENVEFLEILMRVNGWEPGKTRMFVDMGQISEDIIGNGVLNTEDGITKESPIANGIIDKGEDVGIDAIDDAAEKTAYPYPLNLESDPARDNYQFDFGKDDNDRKEKDFWNYNNFEGNSTVSEAGQFPDKENLNANNGQTVWLANSYFTYEINLYPDAENNPQIVGGNKDKGWFLFRLPIRKPSSTVGNPQFSNIQYLRTRFQGGLADLSIIEWRLMGSHWLRNSNFQPNIDPADSVLQIAFVNLYENSGEPDYYGMPPGVEAPRSPTLTSGEDIRLNEQSLSISVKNLRWGEERMAARILRYDIFNYKKIKFFIHGDGSMPMSVGQGAKPKAYAFVRFGIDSANYYEYRRPLVRGWQDIEIPMAQLTAIKQIRDTSHQFNRQIFPVPGDPMAVYAINGNPILTRVQFFGFGIANPSDAFQELSTTMWVDELRVLDPEREISYAGVANYDMTLADLGSVSASATSKQPNFHKLEERFGNRIESSSWNFSVQGNLEKFAPKSFTQMKVPITYTHSEFMENPKYAANSDVELAEAANASYKRAIESGASEELARKAANETTIRSQSIKVQDGWALTGVKLGIPADSWIVNKTINALTMGYSYSQEFERSPIYENRFNWLWKFNLQYALPIPDVLTVKPLTWIGDIPFFGAYKNWKFNFLPSNFSSNFDIQRSRVTEKSRYLDFPSPVIRNFSATRSAQMSWKLSEGGFLNPIIDYNFTTTSTLVPFELDETGRQRSGNELAKIVLFNNGKLIDLGADNNHTQTVTMNIKPNLPNVFSINNYIEMSGSFNTAYQWQNPLQPDPALADVVKKAGYNNTIRFTNSFKLKSLTDSWYGIRGKSSFTPVSNDTSAGGWLKTFGSVVKTIFFDWEKIDVNFNQTNNAVNPGVYGGDGLNNVWSRGFLGRGSLNSFGPSLAYQLGLVTDPHGDFRVRSSSRFPYFGFDTYPGIRPPNAVLQDNFSQNTTLNMTTSRPLWEGATLDINWRTTLGFNRNQTVETDAFGHPTFTNIIAMESFNRSFISFPTIFGFNPFNNTVDHVVQLYNERKAVIMSQNLDTLRKNQALQAALSESFYQGFEAFSLTSGSAGKFLPSLNWGLRWEGLEKFSLWKDWVKRMSLEHVYSSSYQENVQITDNGRAVQSQIVQYGFTPLIGITANFDEKKLNGALNATLRWSTTTNYQVNTASGGVISTNNTNEITAQATYTLRGFDFPLFGITLKNDLEYSFLFTFKHNTNGTYDVLDKSSYTGTNKDGRVLNGNKQIILEPRARYSISNRLTASAFFRYEGTFNEGAAQPGFHTTQIGVDLRISISGGR